MTQGLKSTSSKYRQFSEQKNRALEQVHLHAQKDIGRILSNALSQIESTVLTLIVAGHSSRLNFQLLVHTFDQHVTSIIGNAYSPLVARIKRLRKSAYTLSYLGELEGLGRGTQLKPKAIRVSSQHLNDHVQSKNTLGEKMDARIWHDLLTLKTKIVKAFSIAVIQELSAEDALKKVKASFPKKITYRRPPRTLKPFREADKIDDEDPEDYFDKALFVSKEDWLDAVEDYKGDYLSASRFENAPIESEGIDIFSWEIERDLTDAFVQSVRDGDVKAAQDMGIEEFVWVAIIDDKTDDCCIERNGLTTSEIQDLVDSGDGDECEALYPPAHFNCRCSINPVASANQVEGPDWSSFSEWLDS